jgi:predicted DNA-binding transcriptional regulator YafY
MIMNHYDVFGITNESYKPAEEVELHFGSLKGKYIKSLRLHKSQEVLSDDTHGLRIKLKVRINYDLVAELLSHGDEVMVIKPRVLKDLILERAKNIVEGILRQS